MIIPPLVQSVTEKLLDGMQKFDHSQVHVTTDFVPACSLNYTCFTYTPICMNKCHFAYSL